MATEFGYNFVLGGGAVVAAVSFFTYYSFSPQLFSLSLSSFPHHPPLPSSDFEEAIFGENLAVLVMAG